MPAKGRNSEKRVQATAFVLYRTAAREPMCEGEETVETRAENNSQWNRLSNAPGEGRSSPS
jgi:hypothetical protein